MSESYSIYIMCASSEEGEARLDFFAEAGLPEPHIHVGDNLCRFINHVVADCPTDHALVCHDDVILPATIDGQVACCIRKADAEFGKERWAVMGNAGICALNHRVMRFIKDTVEAPLPWATSHPYPAAHLDGNTLLVNVRSCRARGLVLPENIGAQKIHDLVLVIESYLRGLVCGIDSSLFVIHEGSCDMQAFEAGTREPSFMEYVTAQFVNHRFVTINGPVQVKNSYTYLVPSKADTRRDFYTDCIEPVVSAVYSGKQRKKLHLVARTDGKKLNKIRRLLDSARVVSAAAAPVVDFEMTLMVDGDGAEGRVSLDALVDEYRDVPVRVNAGPGPVHEGYELANAYAALADKCAGASESYVWCVDDSDFVMPSIIPSLPMVLHNDTVTVFDVQVFEEAWDGTDRSVPVRTRAGERIAGSLYYSWLTGEQELRNEALIMPVRLLEEYLTAHPETHARSNEAIVLHCICSAAVDALPLVAAGMGRCQETGSAGARRDIRNRARLATAISLSLKEKTIRRIHHDYLQQLYDDMLDIRQSVPYRLMKAITDYRPLMSLYGRMKPVIWPLIRRLIGK